MFIYLFCKEKRKKKSWCPFLSTMQITESYSRDSTSDLFCSGRNESRQLVFREIPAEDLCFLYMSENKPGHQPCFMAESPSGEVRAWHLGHREIITRCCERRTLSIPDSTLEHHLKWQDPVHVNKVEAARKTVHGRHHWVRNLSDAKLREQSGVKCCVFVVPRAYFWVRGLVSRS